MPFSKSEQRYDVIVVGGLVPAGKKLEGGYLYVGSPVKQVRALNEEELKSLEYSADHYVDVKNMHM